MSIYTSVQLDMSGKVATKKKATRTKKVKALTPRERRLLKILPDSDSMYDALIKAGYSEATAKAQAKRTIDKVVGKSCESTPLLSALEKAGIDDASIAKKHAEGLEAYKVVSAKIVEKDGGAADNDFIEVPDFPARHKHLDTIHKLRNDYPDPKLDITGSVQHVVEVVNYADIAKTKPSKS